MKYLQGLHSLLQLALPLLILMNLTLKLAVEPLKAALLRVDAGLPPLEGAG